MIWDPLMMNALSNQNIIKGRELSVVCQTTPGNPRSTTFYLTKVDNPIIRQIHSTVTLHTENQFWYLPTYSKETSTVKERRDLTVTPWSPMFFFRCSGYYYIDTSFTFKLRCLIKVFDDWNRKKKKFGCLKYPRPTLRRKYQILLAT